MLPPKLSGIESQTSRYPVHPDNEMSMVESYAPLDLYLGTAIQTLQPTCSGWSGVYETRYPDHTTENTGCV